MKIAIVSDIHLEFEDLILENEGNSDVLILGGDICIAKDIHEGKSCGKKFENFFQRCSFEFPHVVYIMGNHEFYHGTLHASVDYMREEIAKYPNIHMLEQEMKILDDILFVGGCLWTDFNCRDPLTMWNIKRKMKDFDIIRNEKREYARMIPADVLHIHDETIKYIAHVVEEHKEKKCIVVTHHAPSFKSIHDNYKNDFIMNGGYASNLNDVIIDNPQIKLWTHGHMHNPFDYMIGSTRIICNPRGYVPQERSFDNKYQPVIVEI